VVRFFWLATSWAKFAGPIALVTAAMFAGDGFAATAFTTAWFAEMTLSSAAWLSAERHGRCVVLQEGLDLGRGVGIVVDDPGSPC